MTMKTSKVTSVRNIGVGVLALLASLPLIYAQRSQQAGRGESVSRSEPAREPVERAPAFVDRADHGSIRHVDTNVRQRPVSVSRDFGAQRQVIVHRDVDADVNIRRAGSEFAFGARRHRLGAGYARLLVNNQPYYYDDGIYYQQEGDDYQEVYPPVGADIPQVPDGAVEIDAGNLTYYYAGGAFYAEQDGGFVVAPTPIGVIVPELPPGVVQVSFNGGVAYQFNGIYYQPIFVNGVTQYTTVLPR